MCCLEWFFRQKILELSPSSLCRSVLLREHKCATRRLRVISTWMTQCGWKALYLANAHVWGREGAHCDSQRHSKLPVRLCGAWVLSIVCSSIARVTPLSCTRVYLRLGWGQFPDAVVNVSYRARSVVDFGAASMELAGLKVRTTSWATCGRWVQAGALL